MPCFGSPNSILLRPRDPLIVKLRSQQDASATAEVQLYKLLLKPGYVPHN